MIINILGNPKFEGNHDVDLNMSLKDIYHSIGGKGRPKLIQIGGALGTLKRGYDIQLKGEEVEHLFIEPTLSYFDDHLCPVDFIRFMLRFVMRELGIVTDGIKEIYNLITKLTEGKVSMKQHVYLKSLLSEQSINKGEALLKRNILYVLEHFEDEISEHYNGYCRQSICRGLFDAQCINACPAHIHIPGFVALIKDGNIEEAYKLMRQENPLSSVCGSVCARPCELRCRRGEITSTVGVRAIQRFISNEALKEWHYDEKCLSLNGKRIAIVGGGPSGLTAAYYLRKTGYEVTVYEKQDYAGGMLAFGVPSYRLPMRSIQDEVKTIEKLGVNIQTGVTVDKDMMKKIEADYDAVVVASGTPKGNKINLEFGHVLTGIEFLKQVRLENKQSIGKKVVVLGGGDVALDCARTALRLNAEVTVVSLETYEQMPASLEEKHHSKIEGIQFKSGYGFGAINGHTIHLNQCVQVADDAGKFAPEFTSSDVKLEEVNTIILAIGQSPETTFLDEVDVTNRGFLKLTEQFKIKNNFYGCGDVIKPTIVIDAIAQGKKVAAQVDLDLGGQGLYVGDEVDIPEKVLNIRTFDYDLREEETLDPLSRIKSFKEVTHVYSIEDALYEANRCMRCDRNSKASLLLGK